MGYYEGRRENPCPRCGNTVLTVFISVGPMSFSEKCSGCGADNFSEEEGKLLGKNISRYADDGATDARVAVDHLSNDQ